MKINLGQRWNETDREKGKTGPPVPNACEGSFLAKHSGAGRQVNDRRAVCSTRLCGRLSGAVAKYLPGHCDRIPTTRLFGRGM